MAKLTTCNGCSTRFDARKALVSAGGLRTTNAMYQRDVALQVRCPNCRREFTTTEVSLFGFLSPNGYRWVVVALLVVIVALMFWLPPR